MGFKDQNWSHLGEEETVERERGEQKKRRGRRRREEEKERRSSQASQRYGTLDFVWKLNLCMDYV